MVQAELTIQLARTETISGCVTALRRRPAGRIRFALPAPARPPEPRWAIAHSSLCC